MPSIPPQIGKSRNQPPEVVDTWPHYLNTAACCLDSPEAFFTAWHDRYLARWPALRAAVMRRVLSETPGDWQGPRAEWVYPVVRRRQQAMARVHEELLAAIPDVDARARALLGRQGRLRYVLWVDVGYGGIPLSYGGRRAILLGLAALGWAGPREFELRELIAHEVAHVAHDIFRERAGLPGWAKTRWWGLYAEGFAQRLGPTMCGGAHGVPPAGARGWRRACRRQERALAAEFLAASDSEEDKRRFFASSREVEGVSCAGYYLGELFIASLEAEGLSYQEIALLPVATVRRKGARLLQAVSK